MVDGNVVFIVETNHARDLYGVSMRNSNSSTQLTSQHKANQHTLQENNWQLSKSSPNFLAPALMYMYALK